MLARPLLLATYQQ